MTSLVRMASGMDPRFNREQDGKCNGSGSSKRWQDQKKDQAPKRVRNDDYETTTNMMLRQRKRHDKDEKKEEHREASTSKTETRSRGWDRSSRESRPDPLQLSYMPAADAALKSSAPLAAAELSEPKPGFGRDQYLASQKGQAPIFRVGDYVRARMHGDDYRSGFVSAVLYTKGKFTGYRVVFSANTFGNSAPEELLFGTNQVIRASLSTSGHAAAAANVPAQPAAHAMGQVPAASAQSSGRVTRRQGTPVAAATSGHAAAAVSKDPKSLTSHGPGKPLRMSLQNNLRRSQPKPQSRSASRKGRHAMCTHNKRRTLCQFCGGKSLCVHNRQKAHCKECRPKNSRSFCKHGRQRSRCVTCKGVGICTHKRDKYRCTICKVSGK